MKKTNTETAFAWGTAIVLCPSSTKGFWLNFKETITQVGWITSQFPCGRRIRLTLAPTITKRSGGSLINSQHKQSLVRRRWTSQRHQFHHGWRSMWIWVLPSFFSVFSASSCLLPLCVALKQLWIHTEPFPPPPTRRSRLITDIWSRQYEGFYENACVQNRRLALCNDKQLSDDLICHMISIHHFKHEGRSVLCQKWIKHKCSYGQMFEQECRKRLLRL